MQDLIDFTFFLLLSILIFQLNHLLLCHVVSAFAENVPNLIKLRYARKVFALTPTAP